MKNRELTYYSLSSHQDLLNKYYTADTMDSQEFITLGFDRRWRWDLWIIHNNEAFLGLIGNQMHLKKLDKILEEQFSLYARKHSEGSEENKEDLNKVNEARKDWLKHTIFICKNEYNKTQMEVFNQAVKCCKNWKKERVRVTDKNPFKISRKDLLKEDNNLIPKVRIEEVFNYFNILTTTANKAGYHYLTDEQLITFVKATFIDRSPKKQNFNCTLNSKKDIRSLFYRFYKKCTIIENKQTSLKTKYFKIMNDAFNGFTQADFDSWNKTNNNIEA